MMHEQCRGGSVTRPARKPDAIYGIGRFGVGVEHCLSRLAGAPLANAKSPYLIREECRVKR